MQQQRSHGQVDHVFRHVNALFVVAHQAPVTHQPCERSLDHPAPWLNSETLLPLQTPHDFHRKVEKRGLVHQLSAVVCRISKQMLHPRPAFDQAIEHHLRASGVGNVGWRQVHRQQATIRVDCDMAFAPAEFLVGVITSRSRAGRFHALAIDNTGTRQHLPLIAQAIKHQRQVMDGTKQHAPHQPPKPVIDRLIRREIIRQHAPLASRPHHVTQRIDHRAQIRLARPSRLRLLWQQRCNQAPLFIFHIRGIATFESRPHLLMPVSILLRPHHQSLQNIKDALTLKLL